MAFWCNKVNVGELPQIPNTELQKRYEPIIELNVNGELIHRVLTRVLQHDKLKQNKISLI